VAIDETAFLQIMISRPIVVGAMIGWIGGDPASGLLLGSILELVYLDIMPVGAAHFPDSGLAAVVGTGTLMLSERHFGELTAGVWLVVILISVFTGQIGGWSIAFLRRRNDFLLEGIKKGLKEGKLWVVDFYHILGIFFSFLRGVSLTLILTSFFLVAVKWAGDFFPPSTNDQLLAGKNLIICASLALGIRMFVSGKTLVYFVLGLGLTLTFLGFGA
jgi:mannose/fructose/N-acetylgalactosamine-specific phosphotransferase system component IIC